MLEPKNIFVTGRPGVGKTTAILKAIELLDFEVNGFTTSEIREGGTRAGFRIKDLTGGEAVLAHVDVRGRHRVGKYGVNAHAVETVAIPALKKALERRTPAIVDEVGKMELSVPLFVETLMEVINSEVPILGTMHKGADATSDAIRAREDSLVIEITHANRNDLAQRLAELLRAACERSEPFIPPP